VRVASISRRAWISAVTSIPWKNSPTEAPSSPLMACRVKLKWRSTVVPSPWASMAMRRAAEVKLSPVS
jgi:hypothetical protein